MLYHVIRFLVPCSMFGIGPLPYKELYSRDERSAYEPHQCSPHYVRSHASNDGRRKRLASYSIFGASPIRPILGHRPKWWSASLSCAARLP